MPLGVPIPLPPEPPKRRWPRSPNAASTGTPGDWSSPSTRNGGCCAGQPGRSHPLSVAEGTVLDRAHTGSDTRCAARSPRERVPRTRWSLRDRKSARPDGIVGSEAGWRGLARRGAGDETGTQYRSVGDDCGDGAAGVPPRGSSGLGGQKPTPSARPRLVGGKTDLRGGHFQPIERPGRSFSILGTGGQSDECTDDREAGRLLFRKHLVVPTLPGVDPHGAPLPFCAPTCVAPCSDASMELTSADRSRDRPRRGPVVQEGFGAHRMHWEGIRVGEESEWERKCRVPR